VFDGDRYFLIAGISPLENIYLLSFGGDEIIRFDYFAMHPERNSRDSVLATIVNDRNRSDVALMIAETGCGSIVRKERPVDDHHEIIAGTLTGRPPYVPRNDSNILARHDVIRQVRNGKPALFEGEGQPRGWWAQFGEWRSVDGNTIGEIPQTLQRICRKAMGTSPKGVDQTPYETAEHLSEDLDAWDQGEMPPHLGPDFWGQGTILRIRKNRAPIIVGVIVILALTIALGLTLQSRKRALAAEEQQAGERLNAVNAQQQEAREKMKAVIAEQKESTERKKVVRVAAQVGKVLDIVGLGDLLPGGVDLIQVAHQLREATDVALELSDDFPLEKATLFEQIGRTYDNLKMSREAVPFLEKSVELYRRVPGVTLQLAGTLNQLAWARTHAGDLRGAVQPARDALREYITAHESEPSHEDVVCAMSDLGKIRLDAGDGDGAEDYIGSLALVRNMSTAEYKAFLIAKLVPVIVKCNSPATRADAKREVLKELGYFLSTDRPRLRVRIPWALAQLGAKIARGVKLPSEYSAMAFVQPMLRPFGVLLIEISAELADDKTVLPDGHRDRTKVHDLQRQVMAELSAGKSPEQ
jgi:hypothetical protein